MCPSIITIPSLRQVITRVFHNNHLEQKAHLDKPPPCGSTTQPTVTFAQPPGFTTSPRELRDEIYDLVSQDINFKSIAPVPEYFPGLIPMIVALKPGPRTALLSVSRQFSMEFRECTRRRSVLVIKDTMAAREILVTSHLHFRTMANPLPTGFLSYIRNACACTLHAVFNSFRSMPGDNLIDIQLPSSLHCVRNVTICMAGLLRNNQDLMLQKTEARACAWIEHLRKLSNDNLRFRIEVRLVAILEDDYDRSALHAKVSPAKSALETQNLGQMPAQSPELFGEIIACQDVESIVVRCVVGVRDHLTVHGLWTAETGWVSGKKQESNRGDS